MYLSYQPICRKIEQHIAEQTTAVLELQEVDRDRLGSAGLCFYEIRNSDDALYFLKQTDLPY